RGQGDDGEVAQLGGVRRCGWMLPAVTPAQRGSTGERRPSVARGARLQVAKRGWALAAGVLLIGALSASPASAQLGIFGTSRGTASVLLQKGRDAFAQGDYEAAASFYQQAQTKDQQLSAKEKADLDSLIQQNDAALKGQRVGREQLKQAGDALDKGLQSKAYQLLQLAPANQNFS